VADEAEATAWLDGRLHLLQLRHGHRAGTDAALLAACAPAEPGPLAIDVGSGSGAVGLAVARRAPETRLCLVERDQASAELARRNIVLNHLEARVVVADVDVLIAARRRAEGLADASASLVLTNPPFFETGSVRESPSPGRASAHVHAKGSDLSAWIQACAALAQPSGRFAIIHRPQALPALLAACQGRFGALRLKPVQARADGPAIRLLLVGIKGSRAPLVLLPALVLHDASGRFTAEAEAIHRGSALIDFGEPASTR
jgi:tRNA1(Val) A37 N6-methylase TrmN6